MKLKLVMTFAFFVFLVGCATATNNTTTQTDPTSSNVATTTSSLEELPADVATDDAEIPEIEPLATSSEQLIGSWKSTCLIPDENSDYAEQHDFVFYPNRTATHTRETFYKKACTGSDMTLVNNYTYTIPTAGQINLTDLETGQTLYDIYMVQTGSLSFGHGFRDKLAYPPASGTSEADRISTLNQYIIYTKAE